ncbi:MAG: DUF2442 domain-containing protein [Caulobacteraceae bacterium]
MAEFKTIDAAAFKAAGDRGKRAHATPRAVSARFDKRRQRIVVGLDAGVDFAFDPKRAQGLSGANADDLVGVTVEGVGSTLHFPRLDADFTVSRLLEGSSGPWTGPAGKLARSPLARTGSSAADRAGRPPRGAESGAQNWWRGMADAEAAT